MQFRDIDVAVCFRLSCPGNPNALPDTVGECVLLRSQRYNVLLGERGRNRSHWCWLAPSDPVRSMLHGRLIDSRQVWSAFCIVADSHHWRPLLRHVWCGLPSIASAGCSSIKCCSMPLSARVVVPCTSDATVHPMSVQLVPCIHKRESSSHRTEPCSCVVLPRNSAITHESAMGLR